MPGQKRGLLEVLHATGAAQGKQLLEIALGEIGVKQELDMEDMAPSKKQSRSNRDTSASTAGSRQKSSAKSRKDPDQTESPAAPASRMSQKSKKVAVSPNSGDAPVSDDSSQIEQLRIPFPFMI